MVEFDALPDRPASQRAAAAALHLRRAALPGVTDVVPAMATLGVHYLPALALALALDRETPYQAMARATAKVLDGFADTGQADARVVEIPVCYGGEHGPDLGEASATCGLTPEELVALHASGEVSVLMLGFAPGHPYIGTFDARLAPPRRSQPRTAVPPGSIGLANRQSVIYPLTLPGGWSLIGRTPLVLFDPLRDPPCLLQAGDRVRFVPITGEEFKAWELAR